MLWKPNNLVSMTNKELFANTPDSLKDHARDRIALGWRFYCVDSSRGYCDYNNKVITIPLWVTQSKRIGQKIWYISHEIAHTYAPRDSHGQIFMGWLRRICPQEYQHFEIEYKPRNAITAGIRKPLEDL